MGGDCGTIDTRVETFGDIAGGIARGVLTPGSSYAMTHRSFAQQAAQRHPATLGEQFVVYASMTVYELVKLGLYAYPVYLLIQGIAGR
ncbi:hypothetical protein HYU15_02000 [Candidatus Woesearchaeota archaeon]|nr:hypothetical protein [Candidatus Woesearchaeota archaeon]